MANLELRRTERTRLMGQAVAYLLHEVNNPLDALVSNISFAQKRSNEVGIFLDELAGTHSDRDLTSPENEIVSVRLPQLKKAQRSAEGSLSRIKETMAIFRSDQHWETSATVGTVDVAYEVTLAIGAAEEETVAGTVIEKTLELQHRVLASSLAIAEAVSVLLKNAIQAVAPNPGGVIRIRAWESAGQVLVTISDNGPGISPTLREQIFMPFFTTKPLGKAVGLGLALAEDTLRRLGGTLCVVPGEGRGATFEMSIPVSKA